ncbi:hypothetical protein [Anaerovorax odorimutans]|uniref:hypothetical protein n=1 Tax=Anaerovorax odorimutans TaxID=109327 RepID=UPI000403121C|nr:hypothetical protein [Anaerovorax odorimutans]
MEIEELLDFLEIESPTEFSFFEHFSDLIECDKIISYDAFYTALSEVDANVLVNITDNYFEDIQSGIPDDSLDLFTLLDTIKQALIGLAQNTDDSESRVLYVDELFKFRNWYIFDGIAHCHKLDNNEIMEITVSQALTLSRIEKLSKEEHSFDFSDCLNYDLDEYALSFIASSDDNLKDSEEESDDYNEKRNLYEEVLIDIDNPAIDGENYEEEEENYY